MAAVIISGMVPPLVMAWQPPCALLFNERCENGKVAWLLGILHLGGAIPLLRLTRLA